MIPRSFELDLLQDFDLNEEKCKTFHATSPTCIVFTKESYLAGENLVRFANAEIIELRMLNNILSTFFVHFINVEIDIISLRYNHSFCETNCYMKDGHLPHLLEGMGLRTSHLF